MRSRSRVVALAGLVALVAPSLARASAPNDPFWSQQWGMKKVHADAAWATAIGRTSAGVPVRVAVIDTGVDLAHEDLLGRLTAGKDFVDGDMTPQDVLGHGTMVAGIVP